MEERRKEMWMSEGRKERKKEMWMRDGTKLTLSLLNETLVTSLNPATAVKATGRIVCWFLGTDRVLNQADSSMSGFRVSEIVICL